MSWRFFCVILALEHPDTCSIARAAMKRRCCMWNNANVTALATHRIHLKEQCFFKKCVLSHLEVTLQKSRFILTFHEWSRMEISHSFSYYLSAFFSSVKLMISHPPALFNITSTALVNPSGQYSTKAELYEQIHDLWSIASERASWKCI